jgi:glucosamine-6-phosphate deaminase
MPGPVRSFESAGMSVLVFEDKPAVSRAAASHIESTVRSAVALRQRAVLGLATGSTPRKVYARLVELHRAGGLSFRDVITYNLDEYYPIQPLNPRSFRAYMHNHLFSHVNIPPHQAHVLDGTVPEKFVAEHCAQFERWIAADGGLDLQLLGIGRNGHIGFNEPGDLPPAKALALPSRCVELAPITRQDAAREFGGQEQVISRALTLGIAPILAVRSILVLATGTHKSEAVTQALKGPMTHRLPASLLQSASSRVTWMLDVPAAAGLL